MNILVAYDGTKEAKEPSGWPPHAKLQRTHHPGVFHVGGRNPRKEFEHAEKELQSQEILLKEEGCLRNPAVGARPETGEDIVKPPRKSTPRRSSSASSASQSGKLLFGSTAQYIILNAPAGGHDR